MWNYLLTVISSQCDELFSFSSRLFQQLTHQKVSLQLQEFFLQFLLGLPVALVQKRQHIFMTAVVMSNIIAQHRVLTPAVSP